MRFVNLVSKSRIGFFSLLVLSHLLVLTTPRLAGAETSLLENYSLRDLYMAPIATVYEPNQKVWNVPGLSILGVGTIGSVVVQQTIDPHFPKPTRTPEYRQFSSTVSDIGLFLPYITTGAFFLGTPLLKKGTQEQRYTFQTAVELCESQVLTLVSSLVLKYAVTKKRPDGSNFFSFPSLHTSMAFSTAGMLLYRYPWYVGLSGLGVATLIGFSRIDLNKHYTSDVIAGAALGLLFSTGVHYLHRGREQMKAGALSQISLSPFVEHGHYGLTFSTQF